MSAPDPAPPVAAVSQPAVPAVPGSEDLNSEPDSAETRLAEVKKAVPDPEAAGESGPVFITRRLQVPITLGPEEILRGAKLRLELEIEVQTGEAKKPEEDDQSQVA